MVCSMFDVFAFAFVWVNVYMKVFTTGWLTELSMKRESKENVLDMWCVYVSMKNTGRNTNKCYYIIDISMDGSDGGGRICMEHSLENNNNK